jgi:hypothetical protein
MNIVYIFGAGASASIDESVPVIANFFEKSVDYVNISNRSILISFAVAEEAKVFLANPEIENISAKMNVLERLLIDSEKCFDDCEISKHLKNLRDAGVLEDIETKYKDSALDCLISQSLKYLENPEDWSKQCSIINKIHSQLEQIVDAYKVAFKKDEKRRIANLEKVFSDLASRKEKSRDANNVYERLQFLIAGIFYELDKDLSKKFSNAAHHDLSEYVKGSHQFKHTFISFNYDIWLEKALFNKGLWYPKNGHGSYHFKYYSPPLEDKLGVSDIHKPKKFSDGNQESRVMVLKPHGSLSWRFGEDYNNRIVILEGDENSCVTYNNTWDFPASYFEEGTELSLTPLIVPPTPNKIRNHPLFQKTDQDISEAIAEADVVVIIGWSMPETDQYIKDIFLETMSERKEQIKKIIVCDKGEMGKTLSTKFESIFRPKEIRVYDEGFGKKFVDFLKKEL